MECVVGRRISDRKKVGTLKPKGAVMWRNLLLSVIVLFFLAGCSGKNKDIRDVGQVKVDDQTSIGVRVGNPDPGVDKECEPGSTGNYERKDGSQLEREKAIGVMGSWKF